jgi:hypothetical protein
MPAAPQPHACSPSHGRSSCVSHTHPMSRQRAHFTLRHRIGGSVIGPHDQPRPLLVADLVLGDGGSLGRLLIGRVDDAEIVGARPHERDAPRPQFRSRLLLGRSHTDRLSGDPRARNARGALADGRLSALSQLGKARLSPKWRVTQQAAMSRPTSFPNRPPGPTWTSQRPTRSGQSRPPRYPSIRAFASPLPRVELAKEGLAYFSHPLCEAVHRLERPLGHTPFGGGAPPSKTGKLAPGWRRMDGRSARAGVPTPALPRPSLAHRRPKWMKIIPQN